MNIAPPKALAYGCLALSMALVGSYVALSKPLVAVLPVFLLAWLRFGIGALAMLHWLPKPSNEVKLNPSTRRLLFLQALLGNFLFSIFMLYGISLSSAVSAGVIMASIPALVAALSWVFLRERLSWPLVLAIFCSVVAMGLMAGPATPGSAAPSQGLLGPLLLFAAALCEASYAVIGKKLTQSLGPKRIAALINLWGLVLMTPAGLYLALDFNFMALEPATWALLLFYALAASVWSVWLWMTGLRSVKAAQSGVFTVMLPASALLVGVTLLGETLNRLQWMAFAVALLGIILASYAHEKHHKSGQNRS
ncbi:MAG: DMT family transporter [Burkholderiaceae bacterium]